MYGPKFSPPTRAEAGESSLATPARIRPSSGTETSPKKKEVEKGGGLRPAARRDNSSRPRGSIQTANGRAETRKGEGRK